MRFNTAVLWMEARVRIKEKKVWIVSFLFLVSLAVILLVSQVGLFTGLGQMAPSQVGSMLSTSIGYFLLILVLILGPASAAARITQEREQRTLATLLNTPLTPGEIVGGKLIATWAYIIWLVSLGLPFLAVSWVWGGTPLSTVLFVIAWILFSSFTASAVAVGMSGFFSRTINAYLATGAFMFFWMAAWPLIGTIMLSFWQFGDANRSQAFSEIIRIIFLQHHPLNMRAAAPSESWRSMAQIGGAWLLISVTFIRLAVLALRRGTLERL